MTADVSTTSPVPPPSRLSPTPSHAAGRQRFGALLVDYLDDHVGDIVAELADLVRLPSISGSDEENEIQAVLAARFRGEGLDVDDWQIPLPALLAAEDFPGVEVDRREATGLVATLHGRADGPRLMLNAHVDVVPPGDIDAWEHDPFSGSVGAGAVSGRGSCDMKGGLVAVLWAVDALLAVGAPLCGDVLINCVQGEEDGGMGTYASLVRGWRADACIIPEPTSLDIVPANAGSLTFRLRVHGLATHASRRTSGVSAIERFWPVFQALRTLEARRNAAVDPLMARWDVAYPVEVGRVHAGDWSSSVPDLLVAEGRYGVALDEDPARARAELEEAVAAASAADPWLRDHPAEVEWWGGAFLPGRGRSDSVIAQRVRGAHASLTSARQDTWGAPYGSDLRLLEGIGGIPTVQYGPGDAKLAHGPREHVAVDEVLTCAKTLSLTALDFCGLA